LHRARTRCRARCPAMNPWLAAGIAVGAALIPCADMCLRGSPERRLVGLEMTGILVVLTLVLLSVGFGRSIFIDLPLTLAIMSFGGGLVYARFLEKHL
jgi:multicomponent Na+:H+ antiporter subunit F